VPYDCSGAIPFFDGLLFPHRVPHQLPGVPVVDRTLLPSTRAAPVSVVDILHCAATRVTWCGDWYRRSTSCVLPPIQRYRIHYLPPCRNMTHGRLRYFATPLTRCFNYLQRVVTCYRRCVTTRPIRCPPVPIAYCRIRRHFPLFFATTIVPRCSRDVLPLTFHTCSQFATMLHSRRIAFRVFERWPRLFAPAPRCRGVNATNWPPATATDARYVSVRTLGIVVNCLGIFVTDLLPIDVVAMTSLPFAVLMRLLFCAANTPNSRVAFAALPLLATFFVFNSVYDILNARRFHERRHLSPFAFERRGWHRTHFRAPWSGTISVYQRIRLPRWPDLLLLPHWTHLVYSSWSPCPDAGLVLPPFFCCSTLNTIHCGPRNQHLDGTTLTVALLSACLLTATLSRRPFYSHLHHSMTLLRRDWVLMRCLS